MNTRLTALAVWLAAGFLHTALFAQSFSTLAGSIVDQSGASLPGVTVVAANTSRSSRQEVTTDRNGRFEMVGLVQGTYTLEADLPGFETFRQKLTLNGENAIREITLQIGSLEETVTVINDPNSAPAAASERVPSRPANCGPSNTGATNGRIGGQIRQPRKIRHVSPIYPQGSPAGIVKIDALIGIDGLVKDTKVTSGASDALSRAAVDAVQQWEFDPTLLNCEAVDVRMAVTVDFR